ncbi:MAG: PilZ domain-containing protein [Planctomycetes bacterium]|nr:PilZ domain-containing protein [Planctomycetota bacterium]
MSAMQTVANEHRNRIFAAVSENSSYALISYHSPAGWRTYKCRFHSVSASGDEVTLHAENMPAGDQGSPKPGEVIGVSFRLGHKKCMFSAVLLGVDRPQNTIVRLRCTGQLHQLQRRVYERAIPPRDVVVPVRFWREVTSGHSGGINRDTRHGQLQNISAGGMRIQTRNFDQPAIESTHRCILTPRPGAPTLIVDAVLRHYDLVANERASLGFQFVGLEATSEGQRLLQCIVQIVSRFKRARTRSERDTSHRS